MERTVLLDPRRLQVMVDKTHIPHELRRSAWDRALLVFQLMAGLSTILALLFGVAVHVGWV